MNNEHSPVLGPAPLVLGILLVSLAYASPAFARSDGSILSNRDCGGCHTGGTGTVALTLSGPEQVIADSENTYTLTISGGPAAVGGLDVWAPDGGTLSVIDTVLTQINDGEVTHITPKIFSAGSVSWDFSWLAPSELGPYALMAQGVSANGDGKTSLDLSGMTSLAIEVVAIPVPAAAILFGSALGLLGWIRRRAVS